MDSTTGNSLSNAVTYDPNQYDSNGNRDEDCSGSTTYTVPTRPTEFHAELVIL